MKKNLLIFILLLSNGFVFSTPPLPLPPTPPPGFPINENLFLLVGLVLVYAFFKIVKNKRYTQDKN